MSLHKWNWPEKTWIPPWAGMTLSILGVVPLLLIWYFLPLITPQIQPGSSLAFRRVQVFDGLSSSLKKNQTVLIKNGRIIRTGAADLAIPEGFYIIQADGLTLMPGLIDLHTYLSLEGRFPGDSKSVDPLHNLSNQLWAGVTTVLDVNSSRHRIQKIKKIKQPLQYPRSLFGGPLYTAAGGWLPVGNTPWDRHVIEIIEAEELKSHWKNHVRFNYDLCFATVEHRAKDRLSIPLEAVQRLSDYSRNSKIPFFVQVQHPEKAAKVISTRPAAITGALWPGELSKDFIQNMKKSGCAYIPALSQVLNAWPARPQIPFLLKFRATELLSRETLRSVRSMAKTKKYAHSFTLAGLRSQDVLNNTYRLWAAGVPIGLGSMSGFPTVFHGLGATTEIEHLLEAGIPLPEVMKIATSGSAAIAGLKQRGRVKAGFDADLLLVEGNPLTEKLAHRHIRAIIRGGKYLPRAKALAPDMPENEE